MTVSDIHTASEAYEIYLHDQTVTRTGFIEPQSAQWRSQFISAFVYYIYVIPLET